MRLSRCAESSSSSTLDCSSAQLSRRGVRWRWFPRKKKKKKTNLKVLQGHWGVMFRFFRSSYENVEFEDLLAKCVAIWLGAHPTVKAKGIYQDLQWNWKNEKKTHHSSSVHLNHILKLNGIWLDFFFFSFFLIGTVQNLHRLWTKHSQPHCCCCCCCC